MFFCPKQDSLPCLSGDEITRLEANIRDADTASKSAAAIAKNLTSGALPLEGLTT